MTASDQWLGGLRYTRFGGLAIYFNGAPFNGVSRCCPALFKGFETMRLIFVVMALVVSSITAYAGGDPVKGASVFYQCTICQAVGPNARVILGPPLNGIAGRRWAGWPDYPYSPGVVAGGKPGRVWDDATLDRWITAPLKMAPGTKMALGGLSSAQQRADIIAYLKQFDRNGERQQQ